MIQQYVPDVFLGNCCTGVLALHAGTLHPVPEKFECPLCMDDLSGSETFALPCGHRFCNECWKRGLTAEIRNEGDNCIKMRCFQGGCNEAVTENVFEHFLAPAGSSSELMDTYQRYCA